MTRPAESVPPAASSLLRASSSEEGRGREDGVRVRRRRPAESVLSAASSLLRASSSEEGRSREDGVGVSPSPWFERTKLAKHGQGMKLEFGITDRQTRLYHHLRASRFVPRLCLASLVPSCLPSTGETKREARRWWWSRVRRSVIPNSSFVAHLCWTCFICSNHGPPVLANPISPSSP
jgi:hypothetical protein